MLVLAIEFRLDVQFKCHRNVSLQEPVDSPIVLNGSYCQRHRIGVLPLINKPPERKAIVVKNGSARSTTVFAIAARKNHCGHLFSGKKLSELFAKFRSSHKLL